MEKQWITEKIAKLKRLHSECGTEEIALSRYIGCMIRMLNGLAQMEYSQFYFYEKIILWDALEIFTEHFIEQTDIAKKEQIVERKRMLIDDIENAVDRMSGVYKNVIDSTANSDRQMLSSISIDTSIYELSPKICAFYSQILNKLAEAFKEDCRKYAFVLHPTLRNNTETRVMFERRAESGKVVIIYISESIIEMFDVVSVFILHEAFHVLTKKERMRKRRMKSFIQLMFAGMKQVLFKDVIFDEDERESEKIEEKLMQHIFLGSKKEIAEWDKKAEDSRDFYGSYVKQWGNEYFQKCLKEISLLLETWIRETISGELLNPDFETYKRCHEKENRIIEQIRGNLLDAMYENKALFLAQRFLFICREIYADIACILTLQLSPGDYENAFEGSKQFHTEEEYNDSTRGVRNYIVAASVAHCMPAEKGKLWKDYEKMLLDTFSQNENIGYERVSTFGKECVMVDITPQMQSALCEYAESCAEAFRDRIDSIDNIQAFRGYILNIRNYDKKELWKNVMTGDLGKIF